MATALGYKDSVFQSTPPVKAATRSIGTVQVLPLFQSTPPVKAATLCACVGVVFIDISIHAAREGGDYLPQFSAFLPQPISIHAAREGGDCKHRVPPMCPNISIHAAREGGDDGRDKIL